MRCERQKGNALVETALVLPIVVTILIGIVEIGNAINVYLSVAEASREGARFILRRGPEADIKKLTEMLTDRLPPSEFSAKARYGYDGEGNQKVTVEVRYDYRLVFGQMPLVQKILPQPFTLSASTTMPMPY